MKIIDFYNNPEDADVQIKVGEKIIHAHRIFLKRASPVFEKGLTISMQENIKGVFEFPDRDPAVVEIIIKHIYGFELRMDQVNAAVYFDVISFADFLCMDKLLNKIVEGDIPTDAALTDLIHCAYLYSSDVLMMRAVRRCDMMIQLERDHEKMAKCLMLIPEGEYNMFRDNWIGDNHPLDILLLFDCYYANQNGHNYQEAFDILSKFIQEISFEMLDAPSLLRVTQFPIIQDTPSLIHLLQCLRRVKLGINPLRLSDKSDKSDDKSREELEAILLSI